MHIEFDFVRNGVLQPQLYNIVWIAYRRKFDWAPAIPFEPVSSYEWNTATWVYFGTLFTDLRAWTTENVQTPSS